MKKFLCLFMILVLTLFAIASCGYIGTDDEVEIETDSVYETGNNTESETKKPPNKYDKYETQTPNTDKENDTEADSENKQNSSVGDIFDWSDGTQVAG